MDPRPPHGEPVSKDHFWRFVRLLSIMLGGTMGLPRSARKDWDYWVIHGEILPDKDDRR